MKKTTLSLLMVMFLITTLIAQTYFPGKSDDPVWKVSRTFYGIGGMSVQNIDCYYGESVEFCGKAYWEVIENWGEGYLVKLGYVRIAGEKVFALADTNCVHAEKLLYDFGLSSGDSVTCGYNMNPYEDASNVFVVREIGELSQYGKDRRYQRMEYNRYPNWSDAVLTSMDWIAGIGATKHPFYALSCIGDFCEIEDTLTQLSLAGELVYNYVTSTKEAELGPLKVFPTVFSNSITILKDGFGRASVRLLNVAGYPLEEKMLEPFEQDIQVRDLPAGIYFLEVRDVKTGRYVVKKLVRE